MSAAVDAARRVVPGRIGDRRRGVALMLGAALSVQFGGAVARLLFARAGVFGAVTLRLSVAAVLLVPLCRPRVRGYRRGDWAVVVSFGLALAGMNSLFYRAIDTIPLGTAVTIEVLGPLTLSVIAARRAAGLGWAGLALAGVVLLDHGTGHAGLDPVGVACALGAGAAWACYIVLSARTGARFPRADGVALAMVVAALASLPLGIATSGDHLLRPVTLAWGSAVALLSSAVPYTFELFALRSLPTGTFALLQSLGPAIAAIAGFLVLHQALTLVDGLAIALVIAASAGAVRSAGPPVVPPDVSGPAAATR